MLKSVHTIAYTIFVVSIIFLTLLAVLSIWQVLEEDVFWKSVATIGVITFSSGITMVVTRNFERELEKSENKKQNPPVQ